MRTLLGVAALLLASASSVDACPLADVQASTWQQDQQFGRETIPFIWYFSPCAAGFPSGQQACTTPTHHLESGFFGQWDLPREVNTAGACQQLMGTQTSQWVATQTSTGNGYQAEFAGASGNKATVIAICDLSASNMQPFGDVVATQIQGGYDYKLTFKSNAICGGSNSTTAAPVHTPLPSGNTYAPPPPSCPVSMIPATVYEQGQFYGTVHGKYTWWLSPCALGFPPSQASCQQTTGYFGEWDLPSHGGACQVMMNTVTSPWAPVQTSDGNGFTISLINPTGSTATITIICDPSATVLQPHGNVIATTSGDNKYNYATTLKSNAICHTPAPPSPTGFPANCASFSTCYDCTTSPSGECGFCSETKTCEKGNSNGPSGGGTCSGNQWRWYPNQCKAQ